VTLLRFLRAFAGLDARSLETSVAETTFLDRVNVQLKIRSVRLWVNSHFEEGSPLVGWG
jgi:hypothetical protein